MKQLIVNADDFGLTEQVSRGILDAHREGIVTSTTLSGSSPQIYIARRSTQEAVPESDFVC